MRYLDAVIALLQEVQETQVEAMERAAQILAEAIASDHLVYAFGPSHAGILAQELFYRAGGLVPVNPILPPGLTTDVRPITLTTRLERLPGLGSQIVAETPIGPGVDSGSLLSRTPPENTWKLEMLEIVHLTESAIWNMISVCIPL